MSVELDVVRSIYEDWERGDFGSLEWAHPDIELVAIGGPDPGRRIGATAVRQAWRDFLSAWRDYRVFAEDYRELGDGRVLVFNRLSGHGKSSGLDVARTATPGGNLFEFDAGKVRKLLLYWDRDRALADLGQER